MLLAALVLALAVQPPPPPPPPLTLRVTGRDFRWFIVYPGPDGLLDTLDDVTDQRHLHLPANRAIAIDLRSDDYVYSLHLPDLEVTELAVPGKPYLLQFDTENPGHYRLMGSQLCGYTHPELLGDLVVHTQEQFETWLHRHEQATEDRIAPRGGDGVPHILLGRHRRDTVR